ncbi:hypothetical protein QL285_054832 [Trifolium repens]|nr:hypothetical protein QL285_054832 [Trifolium repens]
MPPPSSNSKLTMRLVIDTKNEKVLFAETSKPVVDFLFYLLTLPLGTVVKLIDNKGTVGSIENVYQSVLDLNEIYMHPQQSKDPLLNPTALISSNEFCNFFPTMEDDSSGISDFLLVNKSDPEDDEEDKDCKDEDENEGDDEDDEDEDEDEEEEEEEDGDEDEDNYEEEEEEEEKKLLGNTLLYACPNICSNYVTSDKTTICSRCNIAMNLECCKLITKDVAEENTLTHDGFVKNKVTFLVMDDLVIQPLTSIIEVVNKFNLPKISALQEKVVELGLDEGIKLLKASLQSKKVLTSVFIKKDC